MDPFTEKLLERTRARRENLQKKMAERPNAAGRPMAKRAREPLADANGVLPEPAADAALHPSSKPSPSKRRCSEENPHPESENLEPAVVRVPPPAHLDPPTDRKPPAGPASVRSAASLERLGRPQAAMAPEEAPGPSRGPDPAPSRRAAPEEAPAPSRRAAPEEAPGPSRRAAPEEAPAPSRGPAPAPSRRAAPEEAPGPSRGPAPAPSRRAAPEEAPAPSRGPAPEEVQAREEVPAPAAGGMRSRLQRLAAQRNHWDNDASDDVPVSPVRSQPAVAPPPAAAAPPSPSTVPAGRRGRLANLAATIGSWEDDLSHPAAPKDPPTPAKTPAAGTAPHQGARSPARQPPPPRSTQTDPSPLKSTRVVPAVTPAAPQGPSSPLSSPQKALSRAPGPLRDQGPSRPLDSNRAHASPAALDLPAKPARSDPSVQPRERVLAVAQDHPTPQQQRTPAGTPGVKSFLERFGEKCHERATQAPSAGTPARTPASQNKKPGGPPSASLTPNTRLVQEKLRAAQGAGTSTSDLTQRQKMEREAELAQIRSRFQKAGNMWKNKEDAASDTRRPPAEAPAKPPPDCVEVATPPEEGLSSLARPESSHTSGLTAAGGLELTVSPPVSTSSPMRRAEGVPSTRVEEEEEEEEEEETEEVEMNVDSASINSAVINELFEGVLGHSDVTSSHTEEEEEEEDALNISSMSILTPLAETVASVIRSPDRREMMTSTPAGSFLERPDPSPAASRFQRARVSTAPPADGLDPEDHTLPYSVDAYRSIRVKETERPHVKQVIVRKEDVSLHAAAPRTTGPDGGLKQRLKELTGHMNMQQTVIQQASQALNCCTDQEHGKGSPVEAEAQRLLLVATEKRLALKAELERLKGEGPSGQRRGAGPSRGPQDAGVPASKGSITLQELRLPLKADFVCAAANKPEASSHYFFIMIRAGPEHMVATPLASARSALSGDALSFKTKFTMSDVSNDFEVDIQVYCMVMKREAANDKKKKSSKSKAMTPKRFLAITKSSHTPVVASPGGPNAVHTSSFLLVGAHKLTLSSVGKNKFPLEKVPFLCPLEGHIHLKMQCQVGSSRVEERGFLTMFEDVSGFGAWHRRWCVLSGYCISYWTYPDDERRKNPMGRLNLANCTSRRVEPANREFCARPHTMELITARPRRDDDQETLVSQCQNTVCVTKNWLSADTKDERNLWMQKLNQILVDLRMWQPDSCLTAP